MVLFARWNDVVWFIAQTKNSWIINSVSEYPFLHQKEIIANSSGTETEDFKVFEIIIHSMKISVGTLSHTHAHAYITTHTGFFSWLNGLQKSINSNTHTTHTLLNTQISFRLRHNPEKTSSRIFRMCVRHQGCWCCKTWKRSFGFN